jgi:hypothetical protein
MILVLKRENSVLPQHTQLLSLSTMQPLCILAWVLVLLSVPFLLLDRATEGQERKIQRLYQSGSYSQKKLADRRF